MRDLDEEKQPRGEAWLKKVGLDGSVQTRSDKTPFATLVVLCRRSLANLLSVPPIVLRRKASRPPLYPQIDWRLPVCIFLSMILVSVLVLDAPVASYRGLWSPGLVAFSRGVDDVGWATLYIVPWLLVAAAVNLSDWNRRRRHQLLVLYNWTCLATFMLVSGALSGLVVGVTKRLVGRARPDFFAESGVLSFRPLSLDSYYASFPSGQAATIGAFSGVLVLFFPRSRYVVIPLAFCLASTRAVLGAHFPSDIMAGLVCGFAVAAFTAIVFARLGYVFRQKPVGLPEVKPSFWVLW
jgi:undecaprenyl-diphosphatase